MTEQQYPEHEKLQAIKDKSQLCGAFLEWLQRQATLCEWVDAGTNGEPRIIPATPEILAEIAEEYGEHSWEVSDARRNGVENPDYASWGEGYRPVGKSIEDWLALYFKIDLDVLEAEKRHMLASLRAAQEGRSS